MTLHPTVTAVTDRIRQRSTPTRSVYLARLESPRSVMSTFRSDG